MPHVMLKMCQRDVRTPVWGVLQCESLALTEVFVLPASARFQTSPLNNSSNVQQLRVARAKGDKGRMLFARGDFLDALCTLTRYAASLKACDSPYR